ncbi:hypothetical protein BIY28_18905 [Brenneria goodwinii]|nr:hypothetical protein BIY28_18905 [Brenneria goodwinii]
MLTGMTSVGEEVFAADKRMHRKHMPKTDALCKLILFYVREALFNTALVMILCALFLFWHKNCNIIFIKIAG